jgi:hypothetical protein
MSRVPAGVEPGCMHTHCCCGKGRGQGTEPSHDKQSGDRVGQVRQRQAPTHLSVLHACRRSAQRRC